MADRKMEDYQSIIHLPHHVSETRPHMSIRDRAAQFSPFAALTGYDAAVRETARLTDQRAELDEDMKQNLSERLNWIQENLATAPLIKITYFVPDERKEGGAYRTVTGTAKRIDTHQRAVMLADGTTIPIDEIIEIDGAMFRSEPAT
ncbi:MAG: YolD-like family protein [Oscillospiraceae bacterium]|nr:YolD-like family protein [Oscillospiraceae bacterium]